LTERWSLRVGFLRRVACRFKKWIAGYAPQKARKRLWAFG
jgi:hypothetical protein